MLVATGRCIWICGIPGIAIRPSKRQSKRGLTGINICCPSCEIVSRTNSEDYYGRPPAVSVSIISHIDQTGKNHVPVNSEDEGKGLSHAGWYCNRAGSAQYRSC